MAEAASIKYESFFMRQINALGVDVQNTLRKKHVALVGLGGLGSHILQTLGVMGLRRITMIDGDTINHTNLHRQPIYTLVDEGKSKAECAMTYYQARNPFTEFVAHAEFITEDNIANLIGEADVIIDGTDSNVCTVLLNRYSTQTGIPLVVGNVEQQDGFTGVFAGGYEDTPCYECLFPEFPDGVRTCAEAGVDSRAVALIANFQSDLTVETLLDPQKTIGTLVRSGARQARHLSMRVNQDKNCSICNCIHHEFKEKNMNEEYDIKVVQDIPEGFEFIDVRTLEEFSQSPRDAINVPLDQLLEQPEKMPKGNMVLCCASGKRSLMAAKFLKEIGHQGEIHILDQS